jgi:hypothetical protein
MAHFLYRYTGFHFEITDSQQLPLIRSPQLQHIVVIIQNAASVADTDIMNIDGFVKSPREGFRPAGVNL